jgi:preprotein translocase subunit SecD
MNRYPLWRYILIVVLIVLGVLYALPNIFGENPAVQITTSDGSALKPTVQQTLKTTLSSQRIPYISITKEQQSLLVRFATTEEQLKAQNVLQATLGNKYSVALNLAPRTPKWLLAIGAHPMKLGLDLRGGVHFLIAVDVNNMVKTRETADMHNIGLQLREQNIRYAGIAPDTKGTFVIRFRDETAQGKALDYIKTHFPDYTFIAKTQDDEPVIVGMLTPAAITKLRNYALQQNLNILRTRVNELGIAEPIIQQQGASQISVDLPGVQDMARAKSIIGKMATVRFQLVTAGPDSAAAQSAEKTGVVPFGQQLYKDEHELPILLNSDVVLKGSSIINASPTVDENGRPAVSLRLGGSAISRFNRITGENIGKLMATVYVENKTQKKMVDGKVVETPIKIEKVINAATIQSALGNNFQIMGLASMQSAKNLALLLRSGAYTARMTFVEERVVGPSLGKKNIEMGVESLEIGAIVVILFMIAYYRLFGIIANCALILNVVFILAILSILGATLTMAGMAAIVLTVGMAVDANVLINERIREELRNGMSPQASINAGYQRAFSTIVDANVTTLIIGVILLALGSSAVQSFAVTLIIGLLTSMVTAIFFTRAIVNLIYGGRVVKRLSIGIKVK